jgi:hypothetical protein
MYSMSPEFINGPVNKMFRRNCKLTGSAGYLLSAHPDDCLICEHNRLIRKYMFNDSISPLVDWNKDVYPFIVKSTLLELKKIMSLIKYHFASTPIKKSDNTCLVKSLVDELLLSIDIEIESIKEKELLLIKDQLQTMNERLNILFDWIDANNKPK